MSDLEKRVEELEKKVREIQEKISKEGNVKNNVLSESSLTEKIGLTKEEIEKTFHFSGNDFHLIANIDENREEDKLINTALAIITVNYRITENTKISSSILKNKLKSCGVPLNNMTTHIKNNRKFILPSGKPGSHNFEYEITTYGIKRGVEIIKKLAAATA